MKFTSSFGSVSFGSREFTAADGVIDIDDVFVADFAHLISAGLLTPVVEKVAESSTEPIVDKPLDKSE